MGFSTHKYTRPVLVSELKRLNATKFSDVATLANAISPRSGKKSAKFAALKKYVNLNKMFNTGRLLSVKLNIISALSK